MNSITHIRLAALCKEVYLLHPDLMIIKNKEHTTVVFEGTDSLQNWKDNLSFCCRTKHDIHRGFHRQALYLTKKHRLHEVFKASEKVTFTGHSQGAAVALIVAYFLTKNNACTNKDIDIVMFGCPKIGGSAFKQRVEESDLRVTHYVNENDIVAALPIGFGYIPTVHPTVLPCDSKNPIQQHSLDTYIDNL